MAIAIKQTAQPKNAPTKRRHRLILSENAIDESEAVTANPLTGLPNHTTTRPLRQTHILETQRQLGNRFAQQQLHLPLIQRCGAIPCNCLEEEAEEKAHPGNSMMPHVQRAPTDFQVRGRHQPRPEEVASFESFVLFDLADATLDATQKKKIDDFAATLTTPAQPVELVGFASEEGEAAVNVKLANDRIEAVAQHLIAAGHDPTAIKRTSRSTASKGRIDYRRWRVVEMLKDNAASSRPDCSTQPQSTPFGFMQMIGFNLAKVLSLGMIKKTADELRKAPPPASIVAQARQIFGPATPLTDIADGLDLVHSALLAKTTDNTTLGTPCHDSCQGSTLAFVSGGTDEMTLCPAFYEADLFKRAHILIHESAHLTPGLSVTDRAYGWERLVNVLGKIAPAHALDNADSFALLVLLDNGLGGILGTVTPTDDLSALPPVGQEKIAEALAYLQRWNTRSRQQLNWLYNAINEGIASSVWDPDVLDAMRFVAAQFGLSVDATQPRDRDRAAIAAIYDRFIIMGRALRQPLEVTKASGNTTWEPGPGKKVAVAPSLWGKDVLVRVQLLLWRLATATPDVRPGLESAYVALSDKLRQDRGEGP
jgi:outer membrane protein OmpA-like peptidoglycan-associated protein